MHRPLEKYGFSGSFGSLFLAVIRVRSMLAHEVFFLHILRQIHPGLCFRQRLGMPRHHGDLLQYHRVMHRFHGVLAPGERSVMPCQHAGNMFRVQPVLFEVRSDHPARSVAAWGKHAEYLTSCHDLSNIFGEGSPIGKLYELDGFVLLIGVGYDKNTSLHLADVRSDYPGKHNCLEYSAIMENGKRVWKEYETLYVDGEDFDEIGADFERTEAVHIAQLGNAELRLMNQRRLVDFAVDWITHHRR